MDSTPAQLSTAELLHDLLAADRELADFLNELAAVAASEITGDLRVLAGITLERDKRTIIVGSSDAEARKMDEVQAGFMEGPCLHAQTYQELVQVPDVQYETRWPDYMAAVREHGLRSVLAIPLELDATAKAAMNFYTTVPGAFTETRSATARRFADLVSRALRVAVRIARYEELSDARQRAMESRTIIDISVGITMAQAQCSQDEAITILKTASSHRNIKLRELAEDLVASLGQSAPITAFED